VQSSRAPPCGCCLRARLSIELFRVAPSELTLISLSTLCRPRDAPPVRTLPPGAIAAAVLLPLICCLLGLGGAVYCVKGRRAGRDCWEAPPVRPLASKMEIGAESPPARQSGLVLRELEMPHRGSPHAL
jgi:hypothetical protein